MRPLSSRATAIGVAVVVMFGAAIPTITAAQRSASADDVTPSASATAVSPTGCTEPATAAALRTALRPRLADEIAGYTQTTHANATELALAKQSLRSVRADPRSTASDIGNAKADLLQATTTRTIIASALKSAESDQAQLDECGLVLQQHLTAEAATRTTGLAVLTLRTSRTQARTHLRWDKVSRTANLGATEDVVAFWDGVVAKDRATIAGIDASIAALQP